MQSSSVVLVTVPYSREDDKNPGKNSAIEEFRIWVEERWKTYLISHSRSSPILLSKYPPHAIQCWFTLNYLSKWVEICCITQNQVSSHNTIGLVSNIRIQGNILGTPSASLSDSFFPQYFLLLNCVVPRIHSLTLDKTDLSQTSNRLGVSLLYLAWRSFFEIVGWS